MSLTTERAHAPGGEPPAASEMDDRDPRARWLHWLVPVLLVFAGVGILLYPVVATQYNNVKQREFSRQYNSNVEQVEERELSADFVAAQAYNKTIGGIPILDPWLAMVSKRDPKSGPYRDYLAQLSRFDAMGRVRVPRVDIDLPIYHGTTDDVITKGAGHLYGTSLPVGGDGTHAVLTSHTGMATATLFDHLTSMRKGDLMLIDVVGETLAYEVDQMKVVLPTEIDDLKAVPGRDQLTLFTCTPYSINSHRLLVTGHRVPYEPTVAPEPTTLEAAFTLEPWMWGLIAGAVVSLLALALIIRRARRADAPAAEPAPQPTSAG